MAALLQTPTDALTLSMRAAVVDIETDGGLARGAMSVDWYNHAGVTPNACLVTRMDKQAFFGMLQRAVVRD
jgi:inosine-uridine nucleoside N-ribohydrolase